jgi:hypothetical protein
MPMPSLKKPCSLSLTLGVTLLWLTASLGAQTPPWKPFESSTDGFRAVFPSDPEVSRNSVPAGEDTLELRSYVVVTGSTALYIGVCDYGRKGAAADPDAFLASAKHGAVEHINAHILSENKITLNAARGVGFEAENDTLHFSVHIYIAGGMLYQIIVSSPLNEKYADSARFLDSFQLLPPRAAQ